MISDVLKLTMDAIKPSLTITERIVFQSAAGSFNKRHTDSNANFTTAGGLAIERTSAKCCFLIALTAKWILLFNLNRY